MRPSASPWENEYLERREAIGFARVNSASAVVCKPMTLTKCVVYGDDFTFQGYQEDLKRVEEAMCGWYEINVRGVL